MSKEAVLLVMYRKKRAGLLQFLGAVPVALLTACRCAEALDCLSRNGGIGVVLTDTDLPDGTWDLPLRNVQRRSPETPVVVCTSFPTPKLVAEVFEQGAFDLLMAPYTER